MMEESNVHVPVTHNRLGGRFEVLNWKYLVKAVQQVFHENLDSEGARGLKGCSEDWTLRGSVRREITRRVRDKWAQLAGEHPSHFPFNKSCVAWVYLLLRKRNKNEVETFDQNLDAYFPKRDL